MEDIKPVLSGFLWPPVNYHLGAVIESIVWMQPPGPDCRVLNRLRGKLGLELDLDRGGLCQATHQGEKDKLGFDKISYIKVS